MGVTSDELMSSVGASSAVVPSSAVRGRPSSSLGWLNAREPRLAREGGVVG